MCDDLLVQNCLVHSHISESNPVCCWHTLVINTTTSKRHTLLLKTWTPVIFHNIYDKLHIYSRASDSQTQINPESELNYNLISNSAVKILFSTSPNLCLGRWPVESGESSVIISKPSVTNRTNHLWLCLHTINHEELEVIPHWRWNRPWRSISLHLVWYILFILS